ncbi:hypothetical protein AVEN_26091-1 [Araneus ventricosus]|uniref:Uncharacterized protein n=1 Tax=Araneus ventricosus TaxID=182803 RepID=A0A4Y2NIG5_ARAVE|nr:hypothetical protein AVEN_26091-1 [Araneus ventricosus]
MHASLTLISPVGWSYTPPMVNILCCIQEHSSLYPKKKCPAEGKVADDPFELTGSSDILCCIQEHCSLYPKKKSVLMNICQAEGKVADDSFELTGSSGSGTPW